ncbi:RHS repeat-associated core domain-containing protein [Xanthomonas sp. WHRI 1810A]|uniref:RHS repeat domain-containing protein n=1 Tax=Xanthomonas sp. WHRI 1810A TaxID=3161565 RepID=UPI0032E8D079
MPWNPVLHTHTPVLTVIEPRGLLARSVSFHRADDTETPAERIDHTVYDAAARPVGRWDARLWAAAEQASAAPRNLSYIHSLSGRPLFSDSADAGWSASLVGEAGEVMHRWNARGNSQRVEHDLLLRPVALFESEGSHEGCVERFVYGSADAALRNQCGRLIRHDDPAGVELDQGFDLNGAVVEQRRYFLQMIDTPDWPEPCAERNALLEAGTGLTTGWRYNPLGELLEQSDCQRNVRRFSQTVFGDLKAAALQLKGQSEQVLVDGIHYNAQGRIESETAGNGVVTTALYQPQDGRLIRLKAQRDDGHVLQDLHYEYDAVGNVTRLEDDAQATLFSTNQRIEPASTYRYDTLYQLIEATGRETASTHHGPALPGFQSPADFSKLTNYRQTYEYDAGGNLLKFSHEGAQNHSLNMVTARHSNRSLPVLNDVPPSEADIAAAFDGNGNLRELQPGQTLTWDRRNQLQQVRPVIRESGPDDSESYVYDGSGRRVRKVTKTLARSITHTAEVRYLPGVEIRGNTATGETLNVITLQAGRNSVRVLHWQQGKPEGITNDQIRYGLSDHLGSCTLELDQQAQTISHESYYPFGGTSWWAGRSEVEARYKTVRYSGKERDATGLYYYGLRYYAPWLMRWINPDPAGERGGINAFGFLYGSPLRYVELEGATPDDTTTPHLEMSPALLPGMTLVAKGMSSFNPTQRKRMQGALELAVELLSETRALLKEAPLSEPIGNVLDSTFGKLPPGTRQSAASSVEARLGQQEIYLKRLSTDSGWKIGLFDSGSDIVGLTNPSHEKGNEKVIMMSRAYLESRHLMSIAGILIHEASHATLNTVDMFYHPEYSTLTPSSQAPSDVGKWSERLRMALNSNATVGPREDQGLDTSNYAANMNLLLKKHQSTPEERAKEFTQNMTSRISLLAKNADTYSMLVMSTHLPEKIMARKMADKTWIK